MAKLSKQYKNYIQKLKIIYSRSHKIYNNLSYIKEKIHQENIFYKELFFRKEAIDDLNIDINKPLSYQINKKTTVEEIDDTLKKIHSYMYYISSSQEMNQKIDKTFELQPIALRKLFNIDKKHLLTKYQFDLLVNYNDIYNSTINECLFDINDSQYRYYEIWDDIYRYFQNSEDEFKKYCLLEYGTYQKNKKRYYSDLFSIVDDICLNIEQVIIYLKRAHCLEKYREELIQCFKYAQPIPTIESSCLKDDIATNYYPNKIINFTINLNNSLEAIQENIEKLYKEFHRKKLIDLDLLYDKKLQQIKHETQIRRNRSAEFTFIDKLFIFDAKLLGMSNNHIAEQLSMYYEDSTKHASQNIKTTTIAKHFNEVKALIETNRVIEYATGITIDKIL